MCINREGGRIRHVAPQLLSDALFFFLRGVGAGRGDVPGLCLESRGDENIIPFERKGALHPHK